MKLLKICLTRMMNHFESYIIGTAFLLYFVVGVIYITKGNFPWALVYMSYAMSNLGLMIVSGK
jgi:hypothetical protein